ncbi:iron donor protein CyaY [Pasteurella bettyae]|uniref:Iron-sulfur cluster assembly protein CyaY n=1 Tax=Pasteurella bettyae CCUG 2042 TaxID=1095749 RepID=I3D9Z7_9PAST|nr:iron donor protein CyaY [Pasteurella bettyae]EIJ68540.1 iron donor protein CyaY [Pasteurella bettyae CCUG 2042]SUB22729.1 protein cyaY [Pasteurella bettyae]
MNVAEFHENIDQIWNSIEEQLEQQDIDVDCERQGAVFNITFNDGNQIVINKQEAMLELWLASRLGGLHFAYRDGDWLNHDNLRFWDCLAQAMAFYGEPVSFA